MESVDRYGYIAARIMLAAILLLIGYDKLVDVGDAAGHARAPTSARSSTF